MSLSVINIPVAKVRRRWNIGRISSSDINRPFPGKITPFFAAGLVLAFLALPVYAQFESAEVLGTVCDKTGGSISKASVILTNDDTGIVAKTTTGADGD